MCPKTINLFELTGYANIQVKSLKTDQPVFLIFGGHVNIFESKKSNEHANVHMLTSTVGYMTVDCGDFIMSILYLSILTQHLTTYSASSTFSVYNRSTKGSEVRPMSRYWLSVEVILRNYALCNFFSLEICELCSSSVIAHNVGVISVCCTEQDKA